MSKYKKKERMRRDGGKEGWKEGTERGREGEREAGGRKQEGHGYGINHRIFSHVGILLTNNF